jgi:tripartite-type tricarboxylate transporter receptor subunit TctC
MKKIIFCWLVMLSSLTWANEETMIWVGINPGGPTDQMARHVQNVLQPYTTVSVNYKPGAGGVLALTTFAQTLRDNRIDILVANEQILIHRYLTKKLRESDFAEIEPVAYIGQAPYALIGGIRSGLRQFPQTKLTEPLMNGVAGVGTFSHLIHVLLAKQMSAQLTAVQYQGTAKIISDLLGGHVDTAIVFAATVIPQFNQNPYNVWAVSGARRWSKLPEVPTFKELGLDLPQGSFWAVFIRSQSQHRDKMHKMLAQALSTQASKEVLINRMYLNPQPEPDLSKWWQQNKQYYQNLSTRYDFRTMETE